MLKEKQLRFAEWKVSPTTKEFLEAVAERIAEAKEQLTSASNTHEYDQFVKGMILAYKEVLEVTPVITEEGDIDAV